MKYKYIGIFNIDEDKVYAHIPDLPGCITTGRDLNDAITQLTDAASLWLVVAEDKGDDIPEASPQSSFEIETGMVCSTINVDTVTYRSEIEANNYLKNVS